MLNTLIQGARKRSEGKYRRSLRFERAIYTLKWVSGFFNLLYLLTWAGNREKRAYFPPHYDPVVHILFFNIPGPKIPDSRLCAETHNDTSSTGVVKIVFLYLCLGLYISVYGNV